MPYCGSCPCDRHDLFLPSIPASLQTVCKVYGGIEEGGACRVVARKVEEEVLGGDAVVQACALAQELVGLQSLLC